MPNNKILIIDDSPLITDMTKEMLEAGGYQVIIANDGMAGLEKAREEKPNLILLDVMMPKMDGFQVCRMLKFDEDYKDIPIIMLTARGQAKDKEMGTQVGANDFITKPYQPEDLLAKVKKYLGK